MDPFSLPPLAAALSAAYRALAGLADLLGPFDGAAALAIVIVTLLVRLALIPVGISQARAEQTRARLAPRLRAIQKRYAQSPERLQRETMKLYADEKTSPLAGCLPMLAQAPVVGLIYAVFLHPTIAGAPNALLTSELFGVPLGTSVVGSVASGTLDVATALVFAVLLVLIAAVGEISRRVFRPVAVEGPLGSPGVLRAMGTLHFATVAVALFVPLAAAVYLTVTVAWTLMQRVILRRRYPLPSA